MAVVHLYMMRMVWFVAVRQQVGALEFQRRLDDGILPLYTRIWHPFLY